MGAAENSKVVTRFCQAWSRLDADEIVQFFTEDAMYHNVPTEPYVGRPAIHAALKSICSRNKRLDFEVLHQVAEGSVVINERVDHLERPGSKLDVPVVGVFELEGGKIKHWRDYYDTGPKKVWPVHPWKRS